jgi:hypothetical protein
MSSLYKLGLHIYLGHGGFPCLQAKLVPTEMVVLHTNGIHLLKVHFCDCSAQLLQRQQVMHAGWFPATPTEPRTCATFVLLRHFHILSLTSKVSVYHFYRALERGTDNTGLINIKVSQSPINVNLAPNLLYCLGSIPRIWTNGSRVAQSQDAQTRWAWT